MTTATATHRYWDGNGKWQNAYDEVKKLIPQSGEAPQGSLETLRRVVNAYYDVYNNGGINRHRFESLSCIVDASTICGVDAVKLKELFGYLSRGMAEIVFAGESPRDRDDDELDEDYIDWLKGRSIFYESDFAEILEQLSDWAVMEAWMEHC